MKDSANKSFWQRFAGLYPKFMNSNAQLYDGICLEIADTLKKDMSVLELACGTGQLSFTLAPFVKVFEATDFSEAMIAEAEKLKAPANLKFSVKDATKLPYADESFDAVIISNALHIMPDPVKAMAEIKRVLKKDGMLYAPTFTDGRGFAFKVRTMVMSAAGFKVFYKWNEKQFANFIEENGFSVNKTKMMGSEMFPLCYLEAVK